MPNSYGFTYDEWRKLSTKEKNDWRSGKNKASTRTTSTASDTTYTSGAFAGRTKSEVAALSADARKKIVDDYNSGKTKPKTAPKGKGPKWVTPGQSGSAMTQVGTDQGLRDPREDRPQVRPDRQGEGPRPERAPEPRAGQGQDCSTYIGAKLKHPALLDAAVDAVYGNGVLSPATVRALKAAGYKPSDVARTLGAKTAGQVPSYNDRIRSGEVAGPLAPGRR